MIRLCSHLTARWSNGDRTAETHLLDLTSDGVLVHGTAPGVPGDRIHVEVDLGGGALPMNVELRFVGVTRHGPGFGAAIVGMATEDRARWSAHYERRVADAIERVPESIGRYLRRRSGAT